MNIINILFVNILRPVMAAAILSGFSLTAAVADTHSTKVPEGVNITAAINWGIWIDPDGCMHWWSDGLAEGFMVPRLHPDTGKPYCMERTNCLVENSDVLFETGSANLTASARKRLKKFFNDDRSYTYSIYGHTDNRGTAGANNALSNRRATSVAKVAKSLGLTVENIKGYGEAKPVVPNSSAANMRKNRRVEIVCHRLPE